MRGVFDKRRVLFVTRRFPPTFGGQELLSYELYQALSAHRRVELVALRGKSKWHLFWFLPWAAWRTFWSLITGRTDHIVFTDAVVFAPIRPLLAIRRPEVSIIVLGLDLTVWRGTASRYMRWALGRANRVIAISRATSDAAASLGVPRDKIRLLHPGVRDRPPSEDERVRARAEVERRYDVAPSEFVLLILGRLVKRKGVEWFVRNAASSLPDGVILLVAGTGPELPRIQGAIRENGLLGKVKMLGSVDEDERATLLRGVDLFLMPNVPVEKDMEGFGLVTVEAAINGTPVLAARLEGIEDAVIEGVTGYLFQPGDAEGLVERIRQLADDRSALRADASQFQQEALTRYSAEAFAGRVSEVFGAGS